MSRQCQCAALWRPFQQGMCLIISLCSLRFALVPLAPRQPRPMCKHTKEHACPLFAGWAAMSFVREFDESMKDKYELILVSVSPVRATCAWSGHTFSRDLRSRCGGLPWQVKCTD